jgi:hypothetical protein
LLVVVAQVQAVHLLTAMAAVVVVVRAVIVLLLQVSLLEVVALLNHQLQFHLLLLIR